MKNLAYFLLGVTLLFSTSCNLVSGKKEEKLTAQDFNTVAINNEYIIRLPKYMTEAKNLSEDASLQYQNIFKETYTVIIDEPKQEFIDAFLDVLLYDTILTVCENYRNVQLGLIEENMEVTSKSTPVALKIGKLDAYQVEVDGNVEDVAHEISYLFTFIEGKDNVYMIMSWTLKSRKEKYLNTFKEISQTFRVL